MCRPFLMILRRASSVSDADTCLATTLSPLLVWARDTDRPGRAAEEVSADGLADEAAVRAIVVSRVFSRALASRRIPGTGRDKEINVRRVYQEVNSL